MEARVMASAAVALLLSSACATPETDPDIKDPGPDFGFIPNAIGIVPPGRAYVEAAGEIEHGPTAGERVWRVPVLVRGGVAEDWELRVEGWLLQHARDDVDETTGTGPLQVGFKHRVSRGDGRALDPAWGFEVEVLLPASSGGFDDGKVEPSAWLNFDHTLSDDGTFTWNAGALTPVDDEGDQRLQAYLAGAYALFVTPDLQLYATGSWNYPATDGSSSVAELGAGLYWYLSSRAVLIAGYNVGVTSASPDGLGTLGLSLAF